ncbi:galectin-3-binding protein-like, partial [Tubulanus polymorphus]|uniref:galectin-3-binding protein-like n=1 Tax=Tubulanus polymorphus TaxID=672921 RepID=UPI003DA23EA5
MSLSGQFWFLLILLYVLTRGCQTSDYNGRLSIRLRHGATASEGRVEILPLDNSFSTVWGTICDDGWDLKDASVICRMLGYSWGNATIKASFGHTPSESVPIYLDDVQCSGAEKSILNCTRRVWGVENCGHGEDAGVKCYNWTVSSLRATQQSSASLSVTWSPASAPIGQISHYKVWFRQLRYKACPAQIIDDVLHFVSNSSTVALIPITGLNPYSEYEIVVQPF